MSTLDEEAVDWGDVEGVSMEQAGQAGDDVISLGGAEDLEEEIIISVPREEEKKKVVTSKEILGNGDMARNESKSAAVPARTAAAAATAATARSRPLPPGWRLQEARSGGTYYFNTNTGKTTWDFPNEEITEPKVIEKEEALVARAERSREIGPIEDKAATAKVLAEVAPKPATEKMGIQIKGAARGNSSFRKDEISPAPDTKKREADHLPVETESKSTNNQKRRRSNTPPSAKLEVRPKTLVREPSVASATAQHIRSVAVTSEREGAVKGGWGRRADIAREAETPLAPNADRSRPYDQDRQDKYGRSASNANTPRAQEGSVHPQRREAMTVTEPQRRETAFESRDRTFQRNDEREATRNAYEARRLSPREERQRDSREPRRDPSPVGRRRDDYDRASNRDAPRLERDVARNGDVSSAPRPAERSREEERSRPGGERDDRTRPYPDRQTSGHRDRANERDGSRSFDDRRRDAVAPNNAPRQMERPRTDTNIDQGPYSNRNYSGSTNGYNDRSGGSGGPGGSRMNYQHPAPIPMHQGPGFGPPQGYHPRDQYRNAPIAPLNPPVPFSPGAGPLRGPLSAGAKPLKAWIPPEEKQKRWWNKNTGERKPVSADGSAEGEPATHRDSSIPSSSEARPSYSATRMTDRERELAEREAAIARKERELGLR